MPNHGTTQTTSGSDQEFLVGLGRASLERAFELAESGEAATIADIRRALVSEGYSSDRLTGSTLLAQLRKLQKRGDFGWRRRPKPCLPWYALVA